MSTKESRREFLTGVGGFIAGGVLGVVGDKLFGGSPSNQGLPATETSTPTASQTATLQAASATPTAQIEASATQQPCVENTPAPETEEQKGAKLLNDFFTGVLGLTVNSEDGKLVFTDRDGRKYHVDDVRQDECLEGFSVPIIDIRLKGNQACVIKTKSPVATNTPTLGQQSTQQNTPEEHNTSVPPTRVPPRIPTAVPTNKDAPIDKATPGPKPTKEKIATDVP
jgi:hypothetical protein